LVWLQEEKLLSANPAEKEENLAEKRKAALNAKDDDKFVKNLQSSTRLAICILFSELNFES